MPAFGGLSPYPRRLGGRRPPAEAILRDLLAARGTAYNTTTENTAVYVECLAFARAIAAGFATNERLTNQLIPLKMTDALPRWERILKIIPPKGSAKATRRRAVHDALARAGEETVHATLVTMLEAAIGGVFVALEYIDIGVATIHVPDNTYPFGTVSPGAPWSSTVQHLMVRLQKPLGYTEADFYEAAAKVSKLLDDALPSDMTFAWYRAPVSTPINVIGGPSAGGFYLDDEHNLDNNLFDV